MMRFSSCKVYEGWLARLNFVADPSRLLRLRPRCCRRSYCGRNGGLRLRGCPLVIHPLLGYRFELSLRFGHLMGTDVSQSRMYLRASADLSLTRTGTRAERRG